MIPPLLFRRAEAADAPRLTAIALAGKQHWGYPDDWLAEWRPDLTITAGYLASQPVRVAELAGKVIGFAGLSMLEGRRHLEHLWLQPGLIGRGYGRALFQEAVRAARAVGDTELRIKADPNAEPFYLKMGAVRVGLDVYYLLGKHRREVPLLRYAFPTEPADRSL